VEPAAVIDCFEEGADALAGVLERDVGLAVDLLVFGITVTPAQFPIFPSPYPIVIKLAFPPAAVVLMQIERSATRKSSGAGSPRRNASAE